SRCRSKAKIASDDRVSPPIATPSTLGAVTTIWPRPNAASLSCACAGGAATIALDTSSPATIVRIAFPLAVSPGAHRPRSKLCIYPDIEIGFETGAKMDRQWTRAIWAAAMMAMTAPAASAQTPPACSAEAKPALPAALAGWATPAPLAAATDRDGVARATLVPGKAATVTLLPTPTVHYP